MELISCMLLTILLTSTQSLSAQSSGDGLAAASSTTLSYGDALTRPAISTESKRVCRGTNTGLGHSEGHYEMYRMKYTNCTHVDGNLELVFIEQADFDMSFLRDIREVTGYVLIVANLVSYVPLTNLRIIRGRSLFEHNNETFSLFVALNYNMTQPGVGLKELRFSSLHEIQAGNVCFFDNLELCYVSTINWTDIVTGKDAKVIFPTSEAPTRAQCEECHPSCAIDGRRRCWGTGPEYCQTLTKVTCSPQCDGRCFGPLPNQCCHPECVGGCTGQKKSECWACKSFDNDGLCEQTCPPQFIYSPVYFKQVPNPRAKFAYGSLCVNKCPSHLMADQGACVQDCGAGRIASKELTCVDCNGPCPKTCTFTEENINAFNVHSLINCTIVQGHIKILDLTFKGDEFSKVPKMEVSALSALENIREISGYLQIQANHKRFRNLWFLRNLEIIQGRTLASGRTSLQVFQTSLESLGLVSLREVRYGNIFISNNSRLCYALSMNWEKFRADPGQKIIVQHNRNGTLCAQDNEVCHAECTSDGCWGPNDNQCVGCRNNRLDKQCVNRCEAIPNVYTAQPGECQRCHPECRNNCSGGAADQCDDCRNARDGPYCVAKCPDSKYRDENGICQLCHENCSPDQGCTGPRNSIGDGACRSCALVVVGDSDNNVTRCLPEDAPCDDGYYKHSYPRIPGAQACYKCHPECRTCTGAALGFCTSCVHYQQEGQCVRECSSDYYVVPDVNGEAGTCERCDSRCLSCSGPTAADCLMCKQLRIYNDYKAVELDQPFNCTDKCPEYAPHKDSILIDGRMETICIAEDSQEKTKQMIIIGCVVGAVGLIVMAAIAVVVFLIQKRHAEEAKIRLARQMACGADETLPLQVTDAKPDMSVLKLIKESELKRGALIGSGAFGAVYKGHWTRNANEVVPVAIKVLREGTSPGQNKELLEEARIMASVVDPCCVQILAICMTAEIMLVSELMRHGCLLDYIRKNRDNISGRTLLLWSKQIAQGMKHLESRGIVHRDLAARNVLVQNLDQVKITDFGLAKLLDYNEGEYLATGGRIAIKWLALECIRHRKFTHKSDVWSFGVTLWEMYSYGERPYENIRAIDLPDHLEKGERLSQPEICTVDIYVLLRKCWDVEADGRPSFGELTDEFEQMLRCPQRYLCVKGDGMAVDGSRPLSVGDSGRYMQPLSAATAKGQLAVTEKVAAVGHGDRVLFNTTTGAVSLQPQLPRSVGGIPLAAAGPANPARTSFRYSSEPGLHAAVHAEPPNKVQPVLRQDNDVRLPSDSNDDYEQPLASANSVKYMDIYSASGDRSNREVISEENECDDDGFDSEATITPATSHEYYNSLERLNTENLPLIDNPAAPYSGAAKRTPVRGISESIGSLESGHEDYDHDHDYYNEFLPMKQSEKVALNLKADNVNNVRWSTNGDNIV